MDLKDIKALIDLMQKNGLTAFEMEKDGFRISLAKEAAFASPVSYAPVPQVAAAAAPAAPTPEAKPVMVGKEIISPMVGTLYTAASPESPAFVTVGQKVTPETVVCIIEAMKVMNEIQAEISGTVVECLVANGTSVEFGQPLFRVKVS